MKSAFQNYFRIPRVIIYLLLADVFLQLINSAFTLLLNYQMLDHGFKDYEIARLDRDIAWMRSAQDKDHSQDRADFYRFFAEHDSRRGTDFLATFPEMRSWWEECRYHAR